MDDFELFGWSIIDKYGVCSRTIYKIRHYFGSIEEKDSVDYPEEVLDEVNRYHAGLAPHTIEELYIKKRERLFFDA